MTAMLCISEASEKEGGREKSPFLFIYHAQKVNTQIHVAAADDSRTEHGGRLASNFFFSLSLSPFRVCVSRK
jgi:hypothetical protein